MCCVCLKQRSGQMPLPGSRPAPDRARATSVSHTAPGCGEAQRAPYRLSWAPLARSVLAGTPLAHGVPAARPPPKLTCVWMSLWEPHYIVRGRLKQGHQQCDSCVPAQFLGYQHRGEPECSAVWGLTAWKGLLQVLGRRVFIRGPLTRSRMGLKHTFSPRWGSGP